MTAGSPPTLAAQWRGVGAEAAEEITASVGVLLRGRSHRLLRDLLRPHRRALLLSGALIIGFDVASMVGPFLVQQGIDRGIPPLVHHHRVGVLAAVALGLVVAGVVQAVTDYAFTRLTGRIGQDVLLDLRERVFSHFQSLSVAFHERYTSGRVISRLTSDVDAISELLQDGLQVLTWAVLTVASVAGLMVWLDPLLAGVVFAAAPAVALLTRWFRRNSARAYRATREAIALVIVHFVESLGGIQAVQSFRREPRNQEIFDALNGGYRSSTAWTIRLGAVYGPGVKALGNAALAAVLLVGAIRVEHGRITVGVLAAFVLYLRRFIDPILDLSQFYNLFQAAAAALEKLSGVLEEEPDVPEPTPERAVGARPVPAGARRRGAEVSFRSVSFAYRDRLVLHDVDLTIPAGQTLAVVGETGAGKSTVARLMARFYDPTAGTVTLDGVDLRQIPREALRRRVVAVTQESFLFSRSVADNIAFGRPEASRSEVVAAAEAVGAEAFIRRLPLGFDTTVGKRGSSLSAGQRQLVSLARAFLADPDVLILDEATASLDIPSEQLIQEALRILLARRTAVIIAHRLTTVDIAARVVVIDGGRIVEDGTPDELRNRSSRYHDLHRAWETSLA